MAGSILEGVRSPSVGQGFLDAMQQGGQIYGQRQTNQLRQQQIGEGEYQANLRKIQVANKLAQKALSLPPEARGQLISQYSGVLTSVGFTQEDLAATPLDDAGLQNLVAQTESVIRANMPQDVQQSLPASVQETEWFLRQPKDIQDKHISLKRKTDPTMAEKLDLARGQSEIKVDEAGKKAVIEQNITAASEAADKVMSIESGLGVYDNLVNEIDNGSGGR